MHVILCRMLVHMRWSFPPFQHSFCGMPACKLLAAGDPDRRQVPATLAPGEYILSFRWDCEQTPQVWTTCSSIRVTAPVAVVEAA